jgi:hypothetical protein
MYIHFLCYSFIILYNYNESVFFKKQIYCHSNIFIMENYGVQIDKIILIYANIENKTYKRHLETTD